VRLGDLIQQRAVVDAFFTAARGGDFEALVALLDPDVVLRADGGTARPAISRVIRGGEAVARSALRFARPRALLRPALVNGAAGVVVLEGGKPIALIAFTVSNGKIVEIDAVNDPERLGQIDVAVFD